MRVRRGRRRRGRRRRIRLDFCGCLRLHWVMPVIVGKITAVYGVQGWVKVHSYTRPLLEIFDYARWRLAMREDAKEWRGVEVVGRMPRVKVGAGGEAGRGTKLRAKLAGVDSREAAEGLVGSLIAVGRSQLAKLAEGEYYWDDLIGLRVVNREGVGLGRVEEVLETGANDVLVVRDDGVGEGGNGDGRERLLPWSPYVIVGVEREAGCIRVDWHPDD